MSAPRTPGPWRYEMTTRYGQPSWDIYPPADLPSGSRFPVATHARGADARLIAAAPELLAALQAVADYWAGGDAPADIDAQIRAAIARAGGAL